MTTKIYETTTPNGRQDHDTKEAAIALVEAAKWGRIVTFIRGADGRDRSCAMETWENGAWKGVDISR